MKRILFASVSAAALAVASPTLAQGWAFTFDGSYEHADASGGGTADGFNFDGAAETWLQDSPWGVQIEAGAHGLAGAHDYDGGGQIIYNGSDFRLAAGAVYNRLSAGAPPILGETQYGAGGEFYFNQWLTLSGEGGGIAGNLSGGYGGGTIKGYILPDLSLAGNLLYTGIDGGHETDYGVSAEWMVTHMFPLTVTGSYTRAELSGGAPSIDVFMVGLKLYLGGASGGALVDQNRTGTLDTIGPIHPVVFTF